MKDTNNDNPCVIGGANEGASTSPAGSPEKSGDAGDVFPSVPMRIGTIDLHSNTTTDEQRFARVFLFGSIYYFPDGLPRGASLLLSNPQEEVIMTESEIEEIFKYHPPTAEQRQTYEEINAIFTDAAKKLNTLMPPGPGHTVAIRKLSEARMQCNAAVALAGRF